jgi:hypothetical protein
MKVEIELRGLFPETLRHYIGHIKLLEKYFDKPAGQISPDELKQLSKCLRLTGSNPLIFTIKKYVKTCPACGSSKLIPFAIPKYSSLSPKYLELNAF